MKKIGKAKHSEFNFREMKITYLYSTVLNLYTHPDLGYIYANIDT